MFKESSSILYSNLLYKMVQDFLDIQYVERSPLKSEREIDRNKETENKGDRETWLQKYLFCLVAKADFPSV